MKNRKTRITRVLVIFSLLAVVLSAVLIPLSASKAGTDPILSGSDYGITYNDGVYTVSIDAERLARLVKEEDLYLFVIEEDSRLAGMLTLTFCETLSRRKYWIEDVIVDDAFRGKGFGRALVRTAVDFAREKEGLPTIYLTSNPSRISARSLYMSEGFEEYETGVFRLGQA